MADTRKMLEECLFQVLDVVYDEGDLQMETPEEKLDLIESLTIGTLVEVRKLARDGRARDLSEAQVARHRERAAVQ